MATEAPVAESLGVGVSIKDELIGGRLVSTKTIKSVYAPHDQGILIEVGSRVRARLSEDEYVIAFILQAESAEDTFEYTSRCGTLLRDVVLMNREGGKRAAFCKTCNEYFYPNGSVYCLADPEPHPDPKEDRKIFSICQFCARKHSWGGPRCPWEGE